MLFLLLDGALVVVSESNGDGLLFLASAAALAIAFAVSLELYIIRPISSSESSSSSSEEQLSGLFMTLAEELTSILSIVGMVLELEEVSTHVK